MTLWEVKDSPSGSYYKMPTPSKFKTDWEDLDNKSYRSKNSGNLIDTVVSYRWLKCSFEYNHLSREDRRYILHRIKKNPMLIRIEDDAISLEDKVELKMRCSRVSSEMLEDKNYNLSFNLVQKIKVSGQ